ncbi:MutS domain V protein (macronuclear) [Tetrahymena thermophila SB210]|uniref:MutS domain V protein n=1 Tax=Tetrahymena thermophila (strain SB210) TaxID=312017 RepID=I7MML1_TETTS|nr:MutS domain V protein [Tetrahymena thermophila SB210]EAS05117.2 MutS domain V protein [Tetrahymena thermophila SB210]|eukprot:XP_001025362.2 MutS domain V protein [Tetrahymena thermophila SB210]
MCQISIFQEQNSLGVSYYDPKQNRIFCYQINILNEEEHIQNLFLQFDNIYALIIPLNFNENLVQSVIEKYFLTQNRHLNIQRVLNCEYNFESCINKILQLNFDKDLNQSLQNSQEMTISKNQQSISLQCDENFKNRNNKKYLTLCQQIDIEQKNLIKSLGGLLCFLFNNQIINLNYSFFDIVFLKNINNQIHYNQYTLSYLNIFKEDIHPSMIKGKGQAKEGFSLFLLFSKFVYTKLGLIKLKHLFLTPSFDLKTLQLRNQSIDFFYSQSGESIKKIKLNLQKCSNIKKVLSKLKQVQMNFNDWYSFKITLQSTLNIMQLFLIQNEILKNRKLLVFQNLSDYLFQELQKLNSFLEKYLLFSPKDGEIMIREGIVQELDDLLKIYDNLDEILSYYNSQEIIKLTNNNSNFNSQMMIQYFPQLGFFITIQNSNQFNNQVQVDDKVNFSQNKSYQDQQNNYSLEQDCCENSKEQKQNALKSDKSFYQDGKQLDDDEVEEKQNQSQQNLKRTRSSNSLSSKNQGIENSQNLQQQYCLTNDYSYCFTLQDALLFKNDLCNQLDLKYGDIQSRIIDIQRDIVREIEQQILLYSEEINAAQEFISDLDLFFCLYQAAEVYNLRKPKLTNDSSLVFQEMRNILTEITIGEKQFISNSFCVHNFAQYMKNQKIQTNNFLDSQFSNRFTFITGPNYAGKSVFLKSIGMITYLAHIGSFIPCRFARIGMIDNIFVNTCQHDSVLKFNGESAQQLQFINYILNQATNRTLILIDEFGKNFRLNDSLNLNYSLVKCLTEDTFQGLNEKITQKQHPSLQQEDNDQNIFYQYQTDNSQVENIDEIKQQNLRGLNEFQFIHQDIQNVNLMEQYNKIPITLMASHLSQLVNLCGLRENYIIRFAQMEVLIQQGKNVCKLNELKENINAMQKIVHVYKLNKGLSLKSCSSLVAKNIFRDNEYLIHRINEINQFILEGKFQVSPQQNVEQIHLEKVQKVINILNSLKEQQIQ